MTAETPIRRSPLALAVLALLYEEPMHPYRMQRLIKERGKDEVINVRQRAGLYQTIDRLERAGLIANQGTTRSESWPERTVYALTEAGRRTTLAWLRAMLATPARTFPEFPAALSLVALLPPAEALAQLEARLGALVAEAARLDAQLRQAADAGLPRLFMLETEYARAVLTAERDWLVAVVDDLRAGRLTWSEEWIRRVAATLAISQPPEGDRE